MSYQEVQETSAHFDTALNGVPFISVRLDEAAEIISGVAFKSESFRKTGEFQIAKIANVKNGYLDLTAAPAYVDKALASVNMKVMSKPQDILISMTGTKYKQDYGFVGMVSGCDLLVNQRVSIIRPRQGVVVPEYLFMYLRCPQFRQQFFEGETGGVNQGNVGTNHLRSCRLPLRPLNEQKRIADKLDVLLARVDACRERLERVPQILKRFRQSVLAAAVSGKLTEDWRRAQLGLGSELEQLKSFEFDDASCFGPLTFPSSWEVGRLSDISEILGGMTKDTKKQNSADLEVPYLRVANVQRGFLDLTEMKTIRIPQRKLELLTLEPGDILFTEGGDLDKLGRGWVWSGEIEKCSFQNHIFRARLHNKGYQPKFFSWYSNSYGFYYFLAYGKQTTNLASVNKSLVQALPVVIPSSAEQAEIVKRIDFLFKAASAVENHLNVLLSQSDKLTPSLLAKAFAGELVPQDPNDEPAAEMLARLSKTTNASVPQEKPKRKKTLTASVSK